MTVPNGAARAMSTRGKDSRKINGKTSIVSAKPDFEFCCCWTHAHIFNATQRNDTAIKCGDNARAVQLQFIYRVRDAAHTHVELPK